MTESGTASGTAAALVDAAEAAFAEHGLDRVSLRAIMREAGANPAAVHYHFGSRHELARAVLDRLLEPMQARRLALLSEAVTTSAPDPPALDDVVAALVRPDLEAMVDIEARNPGAARIVGRVYTRPSAFVTARVEQSFAPVAARFLPHLVTAVPDVDPDELAWRVRWVVFGLLGALLSDEKTVIDPEGLDRELARIVTVIAGALRADQTEQSRSTS